MTDDLARTLRELRQARGWSQEQAAHNVGVSAKAWGSWEGGRRTPREASVRLIADCFKVDPASLLPPDRMAAVEGRLAAIESRLEHLEEAIAGRREP